MISFLQRRQPVGLGAQQRGGEVDEDTGFGGAEPSFMMDQVDRQFAVFPVAQDFHQSPVGDRVGDLVGQRAGYPPPAMADPIAAVTVLTDRLGVSRARLVFPPATKGHCAACSSPAG